MNKNLQYGAVLILLTLILSTCNNTFDPLKEDHPYVISMYGFLDVHADTQYVRIMPILNSLLPKSSETPGYTAFLTRLQYQESLEMNPIKFGFGSDFAYWNVQSTEPIYPNETYRIHVSDSLRRKASVTIKMPSSLPVPSLEDYNFSDESGLVTGTYSDTLVSAGMFYEYILRGDSSGQTFTVYISNMEDGLIINGTYRFRFRNFSKLPRNIIIIRREYHVITAAESYPDLKGLTPDEMTIPTSFNNVENGTGFVAGIARQIVMINPN